MKTAFTTFTLFCFCLFTFYGSSLLVFCVETNDRGEVCIVEVDELSDCNMMQIQNCEESEVMAVFTKAESIPSCENACPDSDDAPQPAKSAHDKYNSFTCGECLPLSKSSTIFPHDHAVQPVLNDESVILVAAKISPERAIFPKYKPSANKSVHTSIDYSILLL